MLVSDGKGEGAPQTGLVRPLDRFELVPADDGKSRKISKPIKLLDLPSNNLIDRLRRGRGGGGLTSSAQHHQEDGPTSSFGHVSMGKRGGGEGEMASSAQHHQGDGPASSLGRVSMDTEQCTVVILLVIS